MAAQYIPDWRRQATNAAMNPFQKTFDMEHRVYGGVLYDYCYANNIRSEQAGEALLRRGMTLVHEADNAGDHY